MKGQNNLFFHLIAILVFFLNFFVKNKIDLFCKIKWHVM